MCVCNSCVARSNRANAAPGAVTQAAPLPPFSRAALYTSRRLPSSIELSTVAVKHNGVLPQPPRPNVHPPTPWQAAAGQRQPQATHPTSAWPEMGVRSDLHHHTMK